MELIKGKEYKRKVLHDFYGGQRQGGIATPREHPYIFIISSKRGEDHGYIDGWIVMESMKTKGSHWKQ